MSVWTAVSAGLQIVQEKLDQALGEENEQNDANTLNPTSSQSPPVECPVDQSVAQGSLNNALKEAEEQNRLLNIEYGGLLREKEEELCKLRDQVQLPQDVVELQQQLVEKEQQLKELSLKAETKFNKLKNQAKTKIASLTEELAKVKGELSLSQESFNTSVSSVDQDSVQEELILKTEECNKLQLQLKLKEKEWTNKVDKVQETTQLAIKESVANHEMERTKFIQDIDFLQQELNSTVKEFTKLTSFNEELQASIEKEREEKGRLSKQVIDLMNKMEENEKRMTRDFSFASSEFQVVSSQVSQADSEEEWKIIRASGSSSEGKECSPPPEIVTIPQEESPRQKKLSKGLPLRATPELIKPLNDPSTHELEIQLIEKEKEISSLKEQLDKILTNKTLNTSDITETNYENSEQKNTSDLAEENERLASQLASVREVVSEMEQELNEKLNDIEKLYKQINDLEMCLNETKQSITIKEQLIKSLESNKDNDTKTLQEECNNLRSQLKEREMSLKEEIFQLNKILKERDSNIEILAQEGKKKNEEITQLIQQLEIVESNTRKEVELVHEESLHEISVKHEQTLTEKEVQLKQLLDENEFLKSTQLHSLQSNLSEKDREIANLKQRSFFELETLTNKLSSATATIEELEKMRRSDKIEREKLQREMNRLTESSMAFSADSAKRRENILLLEEQLSRIKQEKTLLSDKLDLTCKNERIIKKELGELQRKNTELSSELERYRNETNRINFQFSSAVDLLKQENQKLQAELNESISEKKQFSEVSEALKEQISAEGERSVSLKEENKQLKTEIKAITLKCANLEEKNNISFQRISELTSIQSQLQLSLESSVKEKELLNIEHETTLRNIEALENKTIELTNEIVTLVREKETSDNTIRLLQRTVASHEKDREDTIVKLESLQNQSLLQDDWKKEKESLVSHLSSIQAELSATYQSRDKLQTEVTELKSVVTSLERDGASLKSALEEAQLEKGKVQSDSKRITELETVLSELHQSHITDQTKLQVLLDTERAAKLEAVEQYQKLQSQSVDYVINFDDGSTDNNRTSLETAIDWIQRFIRKPNVVLMRLVRATPQTIFLFVIYFILIHLLLLYLIMA